MFLIPSLPPSHLFLHSSSSRWFKECCSGSKPGEPNTNDEIYRILSWSSKALEDGREPATDENGQPWPKGSVQRNRQGKDICGGYRMGVFGLKGDLEWFANVYRVPMHWNGTYPCMWCKCCKNDDDPGQYVFNFARGAPWKTTCFTDRREWLAWCTARARPPTPLFHEDGLALHPRALSPDILHCIDLGVAAYLCGSVIFHMVYENLVPGSTLDARMS